MEIFAGEKIAQKSEKLLLKNTIKFISIEKNTERKWNR